MYEDNLAACRPVLILPFCASFLYSKFFKEGDFASVIRKKQSASWALKW